MRDEREPVAFAANDDLLAAELRDAVWTGEDDSPEPRNDDGARPAAPQSGSGKQRRPPEP